MLVGLKEVLAEGKKRGIAVGNFNTPTLECLIAVLDAAEELDVPVIIAHAQVHEPVAPIDKIGPVMVELAKRAKEEERLAKKSKKDERDAHKAQAAQLKAQADAEAKIAAIKERMEALK